MTSSVGGEVHTGWPMTLGDAELAELFATAGLNVSSMSPVARIAQHVPSAPRLAAEPSSLAGAVAQALGVLAAPRQLILLRARDAGGAALPVVGLLNDGAFLIRFDAGAVGCTLGEPSEQSSLAQLVVAAVDAPVQASSDASAVMSQVCLEAIVALRLAGLFDDRVSGIALADAEGAVANVRSSLLAAGDLLVALEADGVLSIDGSVVHVNPEWLSGYPCLRRPAMLTLEAFELQDLAAGRTRRKRVAILGDPAERLVLLPPTCDDAERETVVELVPLSVDAIVRGVEYLLAPPLAPPLAPVTDGSWSSRTWFRGRADGIPLPPWQLEPLEDIVARQDSADAMVRSLLEPDATVEVVAGCRGQAELTRTILSFSESEAVEWTLDGSLVAWRVLQPRQLVARIDELIAVSDAPDTARSASDLPVTALTGLLSGSLRGQAGPQLPPGLDVLGANPDLRWHRVDATHRVGGVDQRRTVLIADSPTTGPWLMASTSGSVAARPIDRPNLLPALAGALEVRGGN